MLDFQNRLPLPPNVHRPINLIYPPSVHPGLPGSVEKFDTLAEKFMRSDSSKYEEVIRETEEEVEKTKGEKQKSSGEAYVKIMKKIQEKGVEYVENESTRVEKLLKEKITNKKKGLFKKRLDILASFERAKQADKDELW